MTKYTVAQVLPRLQHVRRTVDGWKATCPVQTHPDPRKPLMIAAATDGAAVLTCPSGCSDADIWGAVGPLDPLLPGFDIISVGDTGDSDPTLDPGPDDPSGGGGRHGRREDSGNDIDDGAGDDAHDEIADGADSPGSGSNHDHTEDAGPLPAGGNGNQPETESGDFHEATTSETATSRGSRAEHEEEEEIERRAHDLLEDPNLLNRFLELAKESGIAGEEDLIRLLYLVVTSRLVHHHRLHASLNEQSGAGKTESARFVLSTLLTRVVLHLGGGASAKALQYMDDLSQMVVFIDEAEQLTDEQKAFLREAMTRDEVQRLVTEGDPQHGFHARKYTVKTAGMVLIQAGIHVITNPADATRMLILSPDASEEQTRRILDVQAKRAATGTVSDSSELAVWRKAQELLRPCRVVIPFSAALSQLFSADSIRARRDYPRALALTVAHACLHQYQRRRWEEADLLVVEAVLADYEAIHEFGSAIFQQATKRLTPAQQRVLDALIEKFGVSGTFSTAKAVQAAGQALSTVKEHLASLETLGVLEAERPGRGTRTTWHIVAEAPQGLTLPLPDEVTRLYRRVHIDGTAVTQNQPDHEPGDSPAGPATPDADAMEL